MISDIYITEEEIRNLSDKQKINLIIERLNEIVPHLKDFRKRTRLN